MATVKKNRVLVYVYIYMSKHRAYRVVFSKSEMCNCCTDCKYCQFNCTVCSAVLNINKFLCQGPFIDCYIALMSM